MSNNNTSLPEKIEEWEWEKTVETYRTMPTGYYNDDPPVKKEIIDKAIVIGRFLELVGFKIEPHQNDDGVALIIWWIDVQNLHSLSIDINESDFLEVTYEIGKGTNFKIVYREKKFTLIDFLKELEIFKLISEQEAQVSATGDDQQRSEP